MMCVVTKPSLNNYFNCAKTQYANKNPFMSRGKGMDMMDGYGCIGNDDKENRKNPNSKTI